MKPMMPSSVSVTLRRALSEKSRVVCTRTTIHNMFATTGSRRGKSTFSAASRSSSSSSSSSRDVEGAKKLHQSIEEGLLKGRQQDPSAGSPSLYTGAAGPATTAVAGSSKAKQALINATCSFMVVLMAAQSYKSGAEKRRALRELEAVQDELAQSQQTLRGLLQVTTRDDDDNNNGNSDTNNSNEDGPLAALAEVCAQAIVRKQQQQELQQQQQQQHEQRRWLLGRIFAAAKPQSSVDRELLQKQWQALLLPIIQAQLERTVGEAGLSLTERDQKRAQEAAVESVESEQVLVDMMRGHVTVEENDQGERVVKKRLFSI